MESVYSSDAGSLTQSGLGSRTLAIYSNPRLIWVKCARVVGLDVAWLAAQVKHPRWAGARLVCCDGFEALRLSEGPIVMSCQVAGR